MSFCNDKLRKSECEQNGCISVLSLKNSCLLMAKDGQNLCIFTPACLLTRKRLNKLHLFNKKKKKTERETIACV